MEDKQVREINSLRFRWHERLLCDPAVRKRPIALVFAGFVMHHFDPKLGYAECSLKSAGRALGIDKTSIIRARDFLIERGWLQKLSPTPDNEKAIRSTHYSLVGGPDDLDLALHVMQKTAETVPSNEHQRQASFW